jgi:hypothetical protein
MNYSNMNAAIEQATKPLLARIEELERRVRDLERFVPVYVAPGVWEYHALPTSPTDAREP